MRIYFAHHRWKYGTPIEDYEIGLIKARFGEDTEIVNPRTDLPLGSPEPKLMAAAYNAIANCDAFVFSTFSGMVGYEVFNEIAFAVNTGAEVYQLEGDGCYPVGRPAPKRIVFKGDEEIYAVFKAPDEYQDD